jgi:putative nucleotidyltransferase with HDIG domain
VKFRPGLPETFHRVKWKIMLPFMILTALFALFATKNITELVSTSLDDRQHSRLVDAARYASDAIARRERDQIDNVRTLAFTQAMPEAVGSHDARATEALAAPTIANAGVEFAAVVDAEGNVLFGTVLRDRATLAYGPPQPGLAATDWAIVRNVLAGRSDARGDKWAEVVALGHGPYLMTAGPIIASDGRVAGVAIAGSSLGSILATIKSGAFADVTFYDNAAQILGSTFVTSDGDDRSGLVSSGPASPVAVPGKVTRGTVLGRQYDFVTTELWVRHEPVGSLSVAVSAEGVATTTQSARWRMSLIFGAITLAVVAIGWAVSRRLTNPLSRLVLAAQAVSGGDLSARSNVRTGDEIGLLGASFDSMAERLEDQHLSTIGALASAIDARDPYTAGHSVRVGDLSAELGRELGLPRPALHHLRVGGLLHDIGKIGVRDTVLLKAGSLSAEERRLVEQHPTIGLRILESAKLPREVLAIVGGHHERLNGTGYPLGLTAEELSVFPRVAAVADVYDALTTDRPYRASMTPLEAFRILQQDAADGRMDPEVVAAMRRIIKAWEERRTTVGVIADAWVDSLKLIRGRAA